jgi:predicted dehydrogenase/threonine dehydrogenase-like Zn-dependent dehydrogenase
MRIILSDTQTGEIAVHEIPAPELLPDGVLVQTHFSVISSGTERAKIETAEKSLLGKARARPDLVRQVIDFARSNGIRAAYQKVQARLNTLAPLGYSCSGIVLEVGKGVNEFRAGDRVACAGVGYANHSELNFVPRNLAVRVPDGVRLEHAAITTIGAIAMQGLRQAAVSFGETVVVIGAGLIGVLAIQLARAAGCRVVAVDKNEERVKRAVELGAQTGFLADDLRIVELVAGFSRYGADAAIITAATRSSEPLQLATKLLRDRGRIVVVGDISLDVPRNLLYAKELSVAVSRSYGPGRYDPAYEERGIDYPVGYVRWTEQRNMEAFLDCLATATIDVGPLLGHEFPLEKVSQAYDEIRNNRAYTALVRYPVRRPETATSVEGRPVRGQVRRTTQNPIRIGCIGAGGFARGTIFPHLQRFGGTVLEAVATATGIAAESARKTCGFRRIMRPDELIADPGVDALFILTRHDSHARYLIRALERGKPTFIEKPVCVVPEELDQLRRTYQAMVERGIVPFVMVGFNRRFAPFTEKMGEFFRGRLEPMVVHIRINAGYIPRDHWVQQATGGRIVGELCHFVDWAHALVAQPIASVSAVALPDAAKYNRDNVAVTLHFADGSVGNILYLANGDKAIPKEFCEVFCEGGVARLEDFRTLELARGGKGKKFSSTQDKGHRRELELTLEAMRSGTPPPISFHEICEVTEATFRIEKALTERFGTWNHGTVASEVKADSELDSHHSAVIPNMRETN